MTEENKSNPVDFDTISGDEGGEEEKDVEGIGHTTTSLGLEVSFGGSELKSFIYPNKRDDIRLGQYVSVSYRDTNKELFGMISRLQYLHDDVVDDMSTIPGSTEIEEDNYPLITEIDPISVLHKTQSDTDQEDDTDDYERGVVDRIPRPKTNVDHVTEDKKLREGLNMPDKEHSVPIGYLSTGGRKVQSSKTGEFMTYDLLEPDVDDGRESSIFRHMMITGTTGKGKTQMTKNIIRQFVGKDSPDYRVGGSDPKSLNIVVIDPENEYDEIHDDPDIDESGDSESAFDEATGYGFNSGGYQNTKAFIPVTESSNEPDTCCDEQIPFSIPFEIVNKTDISLLVSKNLSDTTVNAMKNVVSDYFDQADDPKYDDFLNWAESKKEQYVEDGSIHAKSWEAMWRVVSNEIYSNVFDASPQSLIDKESDIFAQGTISVIPVQHLGTDERRQIVLSIIAYIIRMKLQNIEDSQVTNVPLSLLVDEAHNFFSDPSTTREEYIVQEAKKVAKQGRKYRLGLSLVTQNPNDIVEDIRDQINTKIFLGLERSTIKNTSLPNEYTDRVANFDPGEALVSSPNMRITEIVGVEDPLVKHNS